MIPPLPPRTISLQPRILNRKQIRKHAPLIHGHPKQLCASFSTAGSQLFACSGHGLLLSVEFILLLSAEIGLIQLPGAMDCPVAQVAVAREAEGSGCERVVEEVSY
jgi:hypothetical protein